MGQARNLSLNICIDLYLPKYISIIEDDLGYKEGLIDAMVLAMDQYYGTVAPNGLKFGLFTGCKNHYFNKLVPIDNHNNLYPDGDAPPARLGGINSCMRCAPTHHWQNVLKGYDLDDYPISAFQTAPLNFRNYNRGFTSMIVNGGDLIFEIEDVGRGVTAPGSIKLWDENYCASDKRAKFTTMTAIQESGFIPSINTKEDVKALSASENDLRMMCINARIRYPNESIYLKCQNSILINQLSRFFSGKGVVLIDHIEDIEFKKEKSILIAFELDEVTKEQVKNITAKNVNIILAE
jgi:hypothetical protein